MSINLTDHVPTLHNFTVQVGLTFDEYGVWEDGDKVVIDPTDWEFTLEAIEELNGSKLLIGSTLTGEITTEAVNGHIRILFPAAITQTLDVTMKSLQYDMVAQNKSTLETIQVLKGHLILQRVIAFVP